MGWFGSKENTKNGSGQAYQLGYQAGLNASDKNGTPIDNPYEEGTADCEAWITGYNDGWEEEHG
jgi:ribosome modulation factor